MSFWQSLRKGNISTCIYFYTLVPIGTALLTLIYPGFQDEKTAVRWIALWATMTVCLVSLNVPVHIARLAKKIFTIVVPILLPTSFVAIVCLIIFAILRNSKGSGLLGMVIGVLLVSVFFRFLGGLAMSDKRAVARRKSSGCLILAIVSVITVATTSVLLAATLKRNSSVSIRQLRSWYHAQIIEHPPR